MSNLYLGDVAIRTFITMYRNGTFQANSANHIYYYGYGLKAGFTDIKFNPALEYKIPANIRALVADVKKSIMNGSFIVPEIKTPVH
jgi:basic membrane lipoprotein Med (substrate-binding protein (PBP1-ABC) superfamily)